MIRIFLDACVFYRAARKLVSGADEPPLSASLAMFQIADRRDDLALLATRYVCNEAEIRLMDENLPHVLAELRTLITNSVVVCSGPPIELTLRMRTHVPDHNDAPVLAGAVSSGADWLVTNNREHFGHLYETEVEGVRVLRPKAAFDRLIV